MLRRKSNLITQLLLVTLIVAILFASVVAALLRINDLEQRHAPQCVVKYNPNIPRYEPSSQVEYRKN